MMTPTKISSWHHAIRSIAAPTESVEIVSVDNKVVVQQEVAGYPGLDKDANNSLTLLSSPARRVGR
jgi:hypothetical protein